MKTIVVGVLTRVDAVRELARCAIGGTVDEMPNPDACLLNYWMNEWLKKLGKV